MGSSLEPCACWVQELNSRGLCMENRLFSGGSRSCSGWGQRTSEGTAVTRRGGDVSVHVSAWDVLLLEV